MRSPTLAPPDARITVAATSGATLANAAGRPGVRIRGRTVVVTGLPARTGIVDVTVYQPRAPRGSRLLTARQRVSATATIRTPAARRLKARVSRGGG